MRRNLQLGGVCFSTSDELFNTIEFLLTNNYNQLCMLNINWSQYTDNLNPIFKYIKKETTHIEKVENYEDKLISFLKEILEIDEIDLTSNLLDYGLDSLASSQLTNWLKQSYNVIVLQERILSGISINEILEITNKKTVKIKKNDLNRYKIEEVLIDNIEEVDEEVDNEVDEEVAEEGAHKDYSPIAIIGFMLINYIIYRICYTYVF